MSEPEMQNGDVLNFIYNIRLCRSVWSGAGKYTEEGITYDLNGNLMTLKRYGDGSLIDNLSYSYTGDQIQSISGGTGNYSYDSNGNMTVDGYHGLTLEYNALGKVSRVKSGTSTKVSYTYLADGTKVSALDASGNGLLYSGAMVFRKEGNESNPESMAYSGGRFVADASGVLRPQIHVVDHQGSVRAIVDKSGNVVERDSYYPYGERWNDGSIVQADNRYRYNGKEEQAGFGLPYLDYGARLYDPAVGRWLTQDPLSEKYYGISPYAFCAGNPMKYVDMDGNAFSPIYDLSGNFLGTDDEGLQGDYIVMDAEYFRQGMQHGDAIERNREVGQDIQDKIAEHYQEANEWYRTGAGQPLYVDLNKINLSGLKQSDVDKGVVNLFSVSTSINDMLVYGSITLNTHSINRITAYPDIYDFEMHDPINSKEKLRNFATRIGAIVAGKGIPFTINIYGSKTF